VEDMQRMFYGAESFDQDLSGWDTGEVSACSEMFQFSGMANQAEGGWPDNLALTCPFI